MPQAKTRRTFRLLFLLAALFLLVAVLWLAFLRPTRILIVNATLAQQADVALNNDSRKIRYVIEAIAQIKGIRTEEAARQLFENALRVYRLA